MPILGGVAASGWVFEPLADLLQLWSASHACAAEATPLSTPWDGGVWRLACFEFTGCREGQRVAQCLYDGGHEDMAITSDDITTWFLLRFRRNGTVDELTEMTSAKPFILSGWWMTTVFIVVVLCLLSLRRSCKGLSVRQKWDLPSDSSRYAADDYWLTTVKPLVQICARRCLLFGRQLRARAKILLRQNAGHKHRCGSSDLTG